MRRNIVSFIAAILMAGALAAQEVLPPEPGIEQTIQDQVEAFQADDLDTAFGYASPGIQGMFGSPDNFGAMVRNGYPMVWRPRDLHFGDLRDIDGALWQKVIVTDQAGRTHILDYRMTRIDGVWRIAGVQILQAPDLSV